jgi:hypothetical protein
MYDGFLKSVQITYNDGEKLDFQYPYADSMNLQFKLFEEVLKQIRKDSLTGNRIFNRSGYLYSKQKELSNLTFNKDSIKYKLLYAK